MKLEIDLTALRAAVSRMGPPMAAEFNLKNSLPPPANVKTASSAPPIIEEGGREISWEEFKEVKKTGNLLEYKGQQILLYMPGHPQNRFEDAQIDPLNGNRVHIAFCRHLEEMKRTGNFHRYIATQDQDGEFRIYSRQNPSMEVNVRLRVCMLCLSKLNYKGYSKPGNKAAFSSFSFYEFFQHYESFFNEHPAPKPQTHEEKGYTRDWPEVSRAYRASKDYTCESCGVTLNGHRHLLHTHHLNGVRDNNADANLRALCADCHSKQPGHDHMVVTHNDRHTIAHLRCEQKCADTADWQEVFDLADPGLNGLLHHLKTLKAPLPEVGLDVQDEREAIVANLELAWPERRVGVAIGPEDAKQAREQGWRVFSVSQCLDSPGKLKSQIVPPE
ncbi:HNH endonuclease [Halomonas urmiana]|uniref:HNH endonuclease n=1 Tax=Halomonas urmiana TaxID=490901 RepID=A0A5R8M8V6_9GAMM|nr:HNH endonuclease [Halomonas urmiana]TLF45937.1 HNH endonuclease [Halomonas urmiana]